MSGRTAIVAGASGLVGAHCLRRLLASGLHEHVVAFVRGPLNTTHKRLEQRTVDYERLGRMSAFPRVQDVFCCLGTTMKKAGSEAAFRKVDYEYVVRLAETSLRTGADHFYLVSAIGADSKSRVFYTRVKGEAEDSVAKLGFIELDRLPLDLVQDLLSRCVQRPYQSRIHTVQYRTQGVEFSRQPVTNAVENFHTLDRRYSLSPDSIATPKNVLKLHVVFLLGANHSRFDQCCTDPRKDGRNRAFQHFVNRCSLREICNLSRTTGVCHSRKDRVGVAS